jgi:isoleucyl-tRNA synthetase
MQSVWEAFTKCVTPIAPHVGEELFNYRFGRDPAKDPGCESVMKTGWIDVKSEWHSPELAQKWDTIRHIRKAVFRVVQEAREVSCLGAVSLPCSSPLFDSHPPSCASQAKVVGGSADATVTIHADKEVIDMLRPLNIPEEASTDSSLLNSVFMTSSVRGLLSDLHTHTHTYTHTHTHAHSHTHTHARALQVELVEGSGSKGKDAAGYFACGGSEESSSACGWAEVRRTALHKCPRCWTHTAHTHAALCTRCARVLAVAAQ